MKSRNKKLIWALIFDKSYSAFEEYGIKVKYDFIK